MSEPAHDLRMTVPEFLRWDDGTETRYKYPQSRGSGKNTRLQHTRWHVCERGHKIYRKRG